MNIYAVIDTNVIVSALLSRLKNTSTVQLMQCLILGVITPIYNDEILAEYYSVLTRPKFNLPESLIDETMEVIKKFGINSSRQEAKEQLPDPKDIVFYEVALANEDSFLVTGNTKHFPKKPFVVTPAEMLQIIQEMKSFNRGLLSEPSLRYGKK